MLRRTATAVLAALALAGVAGCGDEQPQTAASGSASPSPTASPVVAGPPWYDDVAPAEAALELGDRASACPMELLISAPAKWRAKAVKNGRDAAIGGAVPVCEIDAKPAGHLGFLRVWKADTPGNQQEVLDRFLDAYGEVTDRQYRRTKAGPLDALETTYVAESGTHERAILVSTIWGRFLLTLGGPDDAEHQAMLPAYQLAKQTAKNNRDWE
ncbi:lipoprotein [Micromonospora sp. HK10]|uniref:lipoprotein n=1 Tax=Micromonospora sp. HK10 TaxID=1538294 RepID=UPI0006979775|nr:lipoprotein [Micromonospora sp. HK10]